MKRQTSNVRRETREAVSYQPQATSCEPRAASLMFRTTIEIDKTKETSLNCKTLYLILQTVFDLKA